MDKFRGGGGKLTTLFIFSLIIILFFPQFISTVAFEQPKQYVSDRVRETYSLVRTSSLSSWDKVRSLVNQVQKQYFPPDLDFRPTGDEGGHSTSSGGSNDYGATERVRDAAGKSFGASKAAVEESAKSAAEVVGKAVHKTTEKMKKKDCVGEDACHAEL